MTTASGIELLSQEEALGNEIGRIQNELGVVRREAGRGMEDQANGSAVVERAALWNIVIPTRGSVALTEARTMIGALAPAIPARMIVIGRNDASRSRDIRSTIASNVVSRADGAGVVCSEEITLTGPSRIDGHFGALVSALRIPSLPTATFSIDSAAMDGLVTRELLPLSDRLVIDTGQCEHPDELAVLHRLTADGVSEVSDLGWARLSSVRLLWNAMFDAEDGDQALQDATRVTIEHRPRHVSSALLLGAWLAVQLDWNPIDAKRLRDGQLRFRFSTRSPDARRSAVDLYLCVSDDVCDSTGIVAIELRSVAHPKGGLNIGESNRAPSLRESVFSVRQNSRNRAEISTPSALARFVDLKTNSDIQICVKALEPDGHDPMFREVLAFAARLADRLADRTDKNRGRSHQA
jgi:glucose-6-phosphate dehydrogenase assembly protein OpcA